MENGHYYHLCADGSDACNFIISEDDYEAATNLVGVCTANTGVSIVCFSHEDTHPHLILFGEYEDCLKFKNLYERSYTAHIVRTRGDMDNVVLDMEIIEITDEQYLMNAGTYVIVQATKDGKDVMPFDYPWSSGCLYFRRKNYVAPWYFDKDGNIAEPRKISDLPVRERRSILHSRMTVPDDWLVCNRILLPSNYIDIKRFESIYRTCNCYRTFLSSGKNRDEPILKRMAEVRGVALEDMEARMICIDVCQEMFGFKDIRKLNAIQRASLARELRRRYRLSYRQLAKIVRLPESEVRKYIH